jgi:hypothetical protein
VSGEEIFLPGLSAYGMFRMEGAPELAPAM